MARITLLAILCCCFSLSGCDRLSEKEKMEIVALCDTLAMRLVKEQEEVTEFGIKTVSVDSRYSFSDSRCYVLKTTTIIFSRSRGTPFVSRSEVLYDGQAKEILLSVAGASEKIDGFNNREVSGSLSYDGMSSAEATKLISEKMNSN